MNYAVRIKDHWAEQRTFLARTIGATVVILGLAMVLVGRLVDLQILEYEHFADLSRGNRIRIEPLPPTRGLIFDRNGVVLAQNLPTYQLELTPEQVPDIAATLQRLGDLQLIRPQDQERIAKALNTQRRFEAIPLRFQLSDEEVARFAVQRQHFPGVDIRARLRRHYPFGASAVHAIGYVGAISDQDEKRIARADYAGTTHIGKIGIEGRYEEDLHGRVGHQQILVNAQGRVVDTEGAASQELDRKDPLPGSNLYLSLDIKVQQTAEEALGEQRGAIVAIDPRNGDVLALASTPTYDPNQFVAGLTRKEFRALQGDIDKPLFNRAIRGHYPPGSTVKPVIALAGLNWNVMDSGEPVMCRGSYRLPNSSHRYRDWRRGGHGMVVMHDAIAESCDVYFYHLAHQLGIQNMHDFMAEFGFGAPTQIDIPGEKAGLVPSPEWKRRAFSSRMDQVWYPGETVITGIGQGYLLATPLQIAHAAATLATRGQRVRPRLVTTIDDAVTGELLNLPVENLPTVELSDSTLWDEVVAGMEGVMSEPRGTARASAAGASYRIAGKTGTAQVFSVGQDEKYEAEEIDERLRDHALFMAFAPADEPRIAVAVLVENGGSGSGTAAPIARRVLDSYLGPGP